MIIFENKGSIDVRAIKTFGVNVKLNNESAIGYFGTGLKYAIAILLRNNCTISIITGGQRYNFGISESFIRDKKFEIITMNGEELGFTTELGKNWDMWMAFREIMSNMLDENGKHYETDGILNPSKDNTYVLVSGYTFENAYRDRDRYFLNHRKYKPTCRHPEVSIYEKMHTTEPEGYIFYKSVRVMETAGPSIFDYNHHIGLTLTEDRTIKDTWSTLYHVAAAVSSSVDRSFIKRMIMPPPLSYEERINYRPASSTVTEEFLDEVEACRRKYKDVGINPTAIQVLVAKRKITSIMPTRSCSLNTVQQVQLDKAVDFCRNILELNIDDYQLIICKDLGTRGDLGRADMEKGIMYISKAAFEKGTKCVATAILEEYTHCKHEVEDETVQQKWVYLSQIMSLGERIDGKPL